MLTAELFLAPRITAFLGDIISVFFQGHRGQPGAIGSPGAKGEKVTWHYNFLFLEVKWFIFKRVRLNIFECNVRL